MIDKSDDKIIDVSSLIALCQKTENLPMVQKIALKQKVAFRFEYTLHAYMRNESPASDKFATYISLLETKPEFYGNVCEILVDNFVTESVVEECLQYIRSGIIPYHFWTDKLINDIKTTFYYNKASVGGLLAVYLGKTLKASLVAFNKAVEALEEEFCSTEINYEENETAGRMGIVKREDKWVDVRESIAFVKSRALDFPEDMKQEYMDALITDNEEERVKFQENETTIFTETLIDMLKYPFDSEAIQKIDEGLATPFDDFWVTPLFGGGSSTLVSNARSTGNTMQQDVSAQQEQEGGMGSWWEMLGYGPHGETPEQMEELRVKNDEDFHWDNPSFRQFIAENEIDEDFERDIYDSLTTINRKYIRRNYTNILNEHRDVNDPDYITTSDEKRILEQVNKFKPFAEKAYGDFILGQINFFITGDTKKKVHTITNETNVKYRVQKVAKDGSQRVMSENWFDTEREARDFVKEVTESNPVMAKAFEFKVELATRG